MTKHFGILAYPAKHSLSPAIYNAAFKALNIKAQFSIYEIKENDFPDFLNRVKHDPISGLAVSLPYKETIIYQLNKVNEDAEKIKAVNTVVNKGGFLYGYNTDYLGSNLALKEAVEDLKGKHVVVLGAGGASRAICYGLLKEGAKVSIFNRTEARAIKLAEEFSRMFDVEVSVGSLEDIVSCSGGDILIQAGSIWFNSEIANKKLLIPAAFVDKFQIVMDIVYSPLMTPLLETAKKLDKKIITGDKMLLYQAVEQFKFFTGKDAPIEIMRNALNQNLH